MSESKICNQCERIFYKPKNVCKRLFNKRLYCSRACSSESQKKREVITCLFCVKEAIVEPYRKQKFCSQICAVKYIGRNNKGRIFTIEHRKKIAIKSAEKVGTLSCNWKGGEKASYQRRKNKITFHMKRRRALRTENGGSHTLQQWEDMKKLYNNTCLSCGKIEPEILLSQDHIKPLSLGGTDDIENIQPLCMSCNSKKQRNIINYKPLWMLTTA